MNKRPAPLRGRRPSSVLWLPAIALGGVVSAGLLLYALGFFGDPGDDALPREGDVAIPAAAMTIPAYTQVRLEHFFDPSTGRPSVVYVPRDAVLDTTFVDPAKIVGRVLAADKPAGRVFSERDFLPEGTRPGLVAGIPPGKRAMRVEASRVGGIVGLSAGDRIDIVATIAVDPRDAKAPPVGGLWAQQLVSEKGIGNWKKQATVHAVVQSGVVVKPLERRRIPASPGGSPREVEEIVVAVDPEEVAPLTEALAVQARLDAVPRSGRPEDDPSSETPDRTPTSPYAGSGRPGSVRMVETIGGSSRGIVAVPPPVSSAAPDGEGE